MATLHQALQVVLAADAPLVALIPGGNYYERAPQTVVGDYLVRFDIPSDPGFVPLDRPSTMLRSRVQLVAWASSAEQADLIRQAVIAALDGFAGIVEIPDSGSPPDTFQIQGTILDVLAPIGDEGAPTETRMFGRSVDFIFHHQP